jgi:hypothetical protein
MSCEASVAAATMAYGAEIAAALTLAPEQAQGLLREVFDLVQARASARVVPPQTDQTGAARLLRLQIRADDTAARAATVDVFRDIAGRMGLRPPAHADPDPQAGVPLPKLATQHAWRAVWESVEAARAGRAMPEVTREVLAARQARDTAQAPITLPPLLDGAALPPGVAGMLDVPAFIGPGSPLARAAGSPGAAAGVLCRLWSACFQYDKTYPALYNRKATGACIERTRAAGGRADLPNDWDHTYPAHAARAAYTVIGRFLEAVDRGETIWEALPEELRPYGVLPALTPAQQELLGRARGGRWTGSLQTVKLIAEIARSTSGATREALLREGFDLALHKGPKDIRAHAVAIVAESLPDPGDLEQRMGQVLTGRSVDTASALLRGVRTFLSEAEVALWEQRAPGIPDARVRAEVERLLAEARAWLPLRKRGRHGSIPDICVYCGRDITFSHTGSHACAGPTPLRARATGLAGQVQRLWARGEPKPAPKTLHAAITHIDTMIAALPPGDVAVTALNDARAKAQAALEPKPTGAPT